MDAKPASMFPSIWRFTSSCSNISFLTSCRVSAENRILFWDNSWWEEDLFVLSTLIPSIFFHGPLIRDLFLWIMGCLVGTSTFLRISLRGRERGPLPLLDPYHFAPFGTENSGSTS